MTGFWNNLSNKIYAVQGLAVIGLVDILGNIISAIFWIIIARFLGAEQYGHMSYFLAIAGIGSAVSLIGSENTLMVYTPKNVRIQSTIFLLAIIASCIAATTIYFLFYNPAISFLVIGYVIFGLTTSEILGNKLYKSYSKYIILQKILMISLGIGLYSYGVNGIIFGIALSYSPYLIRIYKELRNTKIDFLLLKSKFNFLMNSYLISLAGIGIRSIDKLIVGSILGYSILGNYQAGLQVIEILQLLPAIISKYILPHDSSGTTNIKLKKLTVYFSIGFTILAVFLAPIILPKLFPKFADVIEIVQISSIALIPNSIATIYVSKFLANERGRVVLVSLLIYFAVQMLSILVFANVLGVTGVALSFVLAGIGQCVYLVTISKIIK